MFVLVLVLSATMLFSEENIEERGFYFGIGVGPAIIEYPEPLNSDLELLDALGYDRMTMYINISIGGAISDKSYLLGSVSGTSDSLVYGIDEFTIMSHLFALGFRYYPFTTGLVLGADIGTASMTFQATGIPDIESDSGFGYNILLAHDFDRTKTGFAFQLGLAFAGYDIEDELVLVGSLFGQLVWK